MIPLTAPIRQMRRKLGDRYGPLIYRRALRDLPNPTLVWHGLPDSRLDQIRILRIGDCSWQAIDHAHSFGKPGYPAILAERLREDGVAMRFDDCFAANTEEISLERLTKLTPEAPDAIIVQMGGSHALMEILPIHRMGFSVVRLRINWELGRLGGWLHRHIVSPVVRRFGKPVGEMWDYERVEPGMARLADWIDERFPGVPWAILSLHPPAYGGYKDLELAERSMDVYVRAAVAHGATFLDYRAAVSAAAAGRPVSEFYGASGYDLRAPGHVLIAAMLHEWLRAEGRVPARAVAPIAAA